LVLSLLFVLPRSGIRQLVFIACEEEDGEEEHLESLVLEFITG
jgi:hypothetical protein